MVSTGFMPGFLRIPKMVNRKAVTISFKQKMQHFVVFVGGVQLPGNDYAGLHVEDLGRNLHWTGDWDNLAGWAAAKKNKKKTEGQKNDLKC